MRYQSSSPRRNYTFSLPVEDFLAIDTLENHHCLRAFAEVTMLSDFLDKLPGIGGTEYNGHFGSAVYVEIDTDEEGWEHRVGVCDRVIGWFADDGRRLSKFFPGIVDGKEMPDEETYGEYRLLYTDDDFVVIGLGDTGDIVVGHAAGIVRLGSADFLIETVRDDMRERAYLEEERKWLPETPSRNIPTVREWVASFVPLPGQAALSRVDIEGHPLETRVPEKGTPVWSNPDFVVCHNDDLGISVTFRTRESAGTTWYTDGAASQIEDLVRESRTSAVAEHRLASFLERKAGDDLYRPGGSHGQNLPAWN